MNWLSSSSLACDTAILWLIAYFCCLVANKVTNINNLNQWRTSLSSFPKSVQYCDAFCWWMSRTRWMFRTRWPPRDTSHTCHQNISFMQCDVAKNIPIILRKTSVCAYTVLHIHTHNSHIFSSSLSCSHPPYFSSINTFKTLCWSSFPLLNTMTMEQHHLQTTNSEVHFTLNLICYGTKIMVSFLPQNRWADICIYNLEMSKMKS